jgi:hypothetical protein
VSKVHCQFGRTEITHLVLGEPLAEIRVSRVTDLEQTLLESGGVALGERDSEVQHLFRGSGSVRHETGRRRGAAVVDYHVARDGVRPSGRAERRKEEQSGQGHDRR